MARFGQSAVVLGVAFVVGCNGATPFSGCPSGSHSVSGKCFVACSSNNDCLSTEVCDPGSGVCQARNGGNDAGSSNDGAPSDTGSMDAIIELPDIGSPGLDGGATDAIPNGDPFNPTDALKAYAMARCNFIDRCEPARFGFQEVSGLDSCAQILITETQAEYDAAAAAIAAGRAIFNRSAFNNCLAAYNHDDCATQSPSEACNGIFTGLQMIGDPCFVAVECTPDAYCSGTLGTCGTCTMRPAVGQACSDRILCRRDQTCLADSMGSPVCFQTASGEGAACGTPFTGICPGHERCIRPSGSTAAKCALPLQPGDSCDPTAIQNDTGPTCDLLADYSCVMNHCMPITWGGIGATCGPTLLCDYTANCDPTSSMCVALPGAMEVCGPNASAPCAPGNFCSSTDDTCQPLVQAGGMCTLSSECADSNLCQAQMSGAPMACEPLNWMLCN
jgi:hypothetical protein